MSNTYTIKLVNKNAKKTFAFFQAQPSVTGLESNSNNGVSLGDGDILSSVWVSKGCPSGGYITIEAAVQFYGWDGSLPKKAAIGAKVAGGKALPATIGQGKTPGSTFDATCDGDVVDITAAAKDTAKPSAFEIDTGKFNASAHVLIGMAKPDQNTPDIYPPTAVINATGQMIYQIFPRNDYFVYVSDSKVGEIFDYQEWSAQAAKIKFSENPSKFTATVTYTSDGGWETAYSP